MEMVLNNDFCDMSQNEMMDVDGGVAEWLVAAGAGIVKGCTAVGALVGGGPVIGAVIIVGGVTALGVGIYQGVTNN